MRLTVKQEDIDKAKTMYQSNTNGSLFDNKPANLCPIQCALIREGYTSPHAGYSYVNGLKDGKLEHYATTKWASDFMTHYDMYHDASPTVIDLRKF